MSSTKALSALPPSTMLACVREMLNGWHKPNKQAIGNKLVVRLMALNKLQQQVKSINEQVNETILWIDHELVLLRNPYNRIANKDPRQLTLFDVGFILDESRSVKDDPLGLINKREVLRLVKAWIQENYGNDTDDPGNF